MGVAYNIRRGFGVGLSVPETSFEKLVPMWASDVLQQTDVQKNFMWNTLELINNNPFA